MFAIIINVAWILNILFSKSDSDSCSKCKSKNIIPTDSPVGKKIFKKYHKENLDQ